MAGTEASKKHEPVKSVSEEEEIQRVLPVIQQVKQKRPDAVISIDTYKASVARAAVAAGAEIVNDVSAFRWNPAMAKAVAELKCGAVLMHMRGRPEEWRTLPPVADLVVLVKRELRDLPYAALLAGVKRKRIRARPRLWLRQKLRAELPAVTRFDELHQLRYPLLAGVSRKSFVGKCLRATAPTRRSVSACMAPSLPKP